MSHKSTFSVMEGVTLDSSNPITQPAYTCVKRPHTCHQERWWWPQKTCSGLNIHQGWALIKNSVRGVYISLAIWKEIIIGETHTVSVIFSTRHTIPTQAGLLCCRWVLYVHRRTSSKGLWRYIREVYSYLKRFSRNIS